MGVEVVHGVDWRMRVNFVRPILLRKGKGQHKLVDSAAMLCLEIQEGHLRRRLRE